MGASDEGGKIASSLIDALKGNPTLLTLTLINIMFFALSGFILYWSFNGATKQDELFARLAQDCLGVYKPNRHEQTD